MARTVKERLTSSPAWGASIGGRLFRSSPAYDLIPSTRIPEPILSGLGDLMRQPNVFGVLQSTRGGSKEMRAVCHNTARIFRALENGAPLPAFVCGYADAGSSHGVIKLVLDGVLQVATDAGFVSGLDAYPHLIEPAPPPMPRGRIGRLTIEALQYGQSLEVSDGAALSSRLYRYHTVPLSPRHQRGEQHLRRMIESLGSLSSRRRRDEWTPFAPAGVSGDWAGWRRIAAKLTSRPPGCKLYVSPDCEALHDALPVASGILFRSRAVAFKVGRTLGGLLRPDKMVAYFANFRDLQVAARQLREALVGVSAHGVPFTASLTDDGLLSWGADPSREDQAPGWEGKESWRLWLTNRLASALRVAASSTARVIQPWEFALERIRLDDIDSETFAPVNKRGWLGKGDLL